MLLHMVVQSSFHFGWVHGCQSMSAITANPEVGVGDLWNPWVLSLDVFFWSGMNSCRSRFEIAQLTLLRASLLWHASWINLFDLSADRINCYRILNVCCSGLGLHKPWKLKLKLGQFRWAAFMSDRHGSALCFLCCPWMSLLRASI